MNSRPPDRAMHFKTPGVGNTESKWPHDSRNLSFGENGGQMPRRRGRDKVTLQPVMRPVGHGGDAP